MSGLSIPLIEGAIRECAAFASCAGEPCDADAVVEVKHHPTEDTQVWVPLCEPCFTKIPTDGLTYMVELHGFVPAVAP